MSDQPDEDMIRVVDIDTGEVEMPPISIMIAAVAFFILVVMLLWAAGIV